MAEERLQIILEADVKAAIAGIGSASNELKELGTVGAKNLKQLEQGLQELRKVRAGAETAADLQAANLAIEGVSKAAAGLRKPVSDAAAAMGGLGGAAEKAKKPFEAVAGGVTKVGKAAPGANVALTNFGRVISDAPFGLIGVANNIDPLIESFGRLKQSTGSTGGALKALGGALLGPAGIGIAITAITSTLIAFGPAIGRAIGGISEFDQTLREAGTKGAEAFSKATESFGNYLRVVNDTEASTTRQKAAFDSANKALAEYGLEVSSLSALQKQGVAIGGIYAKIKQEEAKSSILAAKAAESYAKGVALSIAIEQGDTLGVASGISLGNLVKTLLSGTSALAVAGQAATSIGDAFAKSNEEQKLYDNQNEKVKIGIDGLVKQLGQVPGVIEKSDKAKDKSIAKSKEKNKADKEEISALDQIISRVKERQRLAEIERKGAAIAGIQAAQGEGANISAEGRKPAIELPKPEAVEKFNALGQSIQFVKDNLEGIAEAGIGGAIDSVFTALQNGDNVFKALGDSVKGFVIELVKAVAKAVILSTIMNALFPGSQAVAGAVGGGGGGIIGKLLGGIFGGRAGGGAVTPGGGYIVGESGPERFYPSQPGTIVPNGGGMGGGTLTTSISGNSLLILLNQARTNKSMNFG